LTQEEKETLHKALFSRALKEITGGSMREAVMAVEVMERVETGKDTASEVLAALLGDDRVPDEA
jgi:hypothetical protein